MRGRTNAGGYPSLSHITISQPTQNEYVPGELLNLDGAIVTAHYSSGNTVDVTSLSTITPPSGTELVEDTVITATYSEGGVTKTGTCTVTVEFVPEKISWGTGTPKQLEAMLDAHYNGEINIYDYWHVGDTRTIYLSEMNDRELNELHIAQNVAFVLMHRGGKTLVTPINGKNTCAFIVGQRECLTGKDFVENGFMNRASTNSGGWDNCMRRTWCNSTYRNSFPSYIKPLFKEFYNVTADGIYSSTKSSADYFALASEKEVFGSTTYANATAETNNVQFEYYKTAENRKKNIGDGGYSTNWWERSPVSKDQYHVDSSFCQFSDYYGADRALADTYGGISPFGCI